MQTRADGSTVTTYDNIDGLTILQDTWNGVTGDGSQHSITYNTYDGYGNVLDAYQPSAVASYTEGTTTLTVTATGGGLIDVYAYYSSTTATCTSPGNVAGYLEESGVQHGSGGSPVWQTSMDYIAHTTNSITVYYTNSTTAFGTDGGDARTTTYGYTFVSSGDVPYGAGPEIASVTTTLPTVSTTQHGSGTAAASTDIYNSLGQVVWSRDAAGSISYTAYDPATGAVKEQIQDADVDSTNSSAYPSADWALLPTDWRTTDAGAANLTTTYEVDPQGRTIKEVDPNGDTTYTVYNDAQHETIVYPGW